MTREEMATVQGEMVSLRDYFDSKLQAIDEATRIRTESLEARFAGVNEFRAVLSDQATHFVTRAEVDLKMDKLHADLAILQKFQSQLEGKASAQSVMTANIVSAISAVVAIASIVMALVKG